MKINLIVAGCVLKNDTSKLGIGHNGTLPWHLKSEMKHFTSMTKSTSDKEKVNAVLMGRKTWESIPAKFQPLPKRHNAIITRQSEYNVQAEQSLTSVHSSPQALERLMDITTIETCWVIGGSKIYQHFIENGLCDRIYLTKLHSSFECDAFFDTQSIEKNFVETSDPKVPSETQEE
eukprot:10095.XXX_24362_23711_1 [CDS] Oithona nana genome sequencing.